MAQWAVFDVDGTLLPGSSIERRFLFYHTRNGMIPLRNIVYYVLVGIIPTLKGKWESGFKENKNYLRDLNVDEIRNAGMQFVKQIIRPLLSSTGLSMIEKYREKGFRIMIMSGSLDFLICHLEEIFRPDYVVSSILDISYQRFSGKISGLHPYGEQKMRILVSLRDQLKIDFDRSIVFANHHSDIFHMEMFGRSVAVNPTPKLHSAALEHGWDIERWT